MDARANYSAPDGVRSKHVNNSDSAARHLDTSSSWRFGALGAAVAIVVAAGTEPTTGVGLLSEEAIAIAQGIAVTPRPAGRWETAARTGWR